jgi:hypothetical protein
VSRVRNNAVAYFPPAAPRSRSRRLPRTPQGLYPRSARSTGNRT